MITTTLKRIRAHSPCVEGWKTLLVYLGKTKADDEPLPYSRILDAIGLRDTLWCCLAEPQHTREWRLFSVWCARQIQHLMTNPRSIAALDVAERYENGEATDAELNAAYEAASWAAAWGSSGDAAWAAVRATCGAACEAAAWTSAVPAWAAAGDAAWAAQEAEFRRIVG
jgi:hypothetical protein